VLTSVGVPDGCCLGFNPSTSGETQVRVWLYCCTEIGSYRDRGSYSFQRGRKNPRRISWVKAMESSKDPKSNLHFDLDRSPILKE
jgi:hypothetical protein